MAFSEKLKQIIRESGLSISEISSMSGVAISSISSFVNNHSTINLKTAENIASAIGFDLVLSKKTLRCDSTSSGARIGSRLVGFENRNKQMVQSCTGKTGKSKFHRLYEMVCLICAHKYLANGCDVFERKCPNCQHGKPSAIFKEGANNALPIVEENTSVNPDQGPEASG